MEASLQSLFDIYQLTPGRRLYALGLVQARALDAGLDALAKQCEAAREHDKGVLDLEAAWRNPEVVGPVRDRDLEVDRIVHLIHTLFRHYAALGDPLALELQTRAFPEGPVAHTSLAFVEQKAANERLLDLLGAAEHQSWLATHGFVPLATQLAEAHAAFAKVLSARDEAAGPSFTEVKAARQAGQERYLELIAAIISATPGNPSLRASLLDPIRSQEHQVELARRQRKVPAEVDPDSGQPLDALAEAGE